jgi:hypothetical protein
MHCNLNNELKHEERRTKYKREYNHPYAFDIKCQIEHECLTRNFKTGPLDLQFFDLSIVFILPT